LTAYEPDAHTLEITAERYKQSHPDVRFVGGENGLTSLSPGSFDLLTAFDVLEHCGDDLDTLLRWSKLLKPNGQMLITVPAFPSLWGANDELSHHFRRYTRSTLANAFARAQLETLKISYINAFSFLPVWVSRKIKEPIDKIINPNKPAPWDFSLPPVPANKFLEFAFACEKNLLPYADLPFGTSLIAVTRRSPAVPRESAVAGATRSIGDPIGK